MNYAVKTGLKARQKSCHQLFRFQFFLFVVMRHCSNCLETFKFFNVYWWIMELSHWFEAGFSPKSLGKSSA